MNISIKSLASAPLSDIHSLILDAFSMHSSTAFPMHAWEILQQLYSIEPESDDEQRGFLLFDGDHPVGLALWESNNEDASARLLLFCVESAYQRRGLGSTILTETISRLGSMGVREIFAECNERFTNAHRLLDRFNFGFVGIRMEELYSEYLGHCVMYLHRVGKKLYRPKKRRKKGQVLV